MTPRHHHRATRRTFMAIPAALATATSVIFGLQAVHVEAEATPDVDAAHRDGIKPATARAAVKTTPLSREKDGTYVVRAGDTLLDIAAGFRVSTVELLAANGLSWRTLLVVGQRLNVPQSTSGTAEHDRIDTLVRHHVSTGETLEAIARAHKVQPRALMSANGLSRTSRLIVGQRLVIPNAQVMSGLEALA